MSSKVLLGLACSHEVFHPDAKSLAWKVMPFSFDLGKGKGASCVLSNPSIAQLSFVMLASVGRVDSSWIVPNFAILFPERTFLTLLLKQTCCFRSHNIFSFTIIWQGFLECQVWLAAEETEVNTMCFLLPRSSQLSQFLFKTNNTYIKYSKRLNT